MAVVVRNGAPQVDDRLAAREQAADVADEAAVAVGDDGPRAALQEAGRVVVDPLAGDGRRVGAVPPGSELPDA